MKTESASKPAGHWLDSWHVDPSANREYDFIDGLRGVAILMVLVGHSIYAREQETMAGKFLLNFAGTFGMGVSLFFTLSGFLISWPFWKRKVNGSASVVPRGYGWRRFWKIYPPLALSVLLLTPVYILLHGEAGGYAGTAAEWLTGVAFFTPVSGKLNPVMWSLVVEIHFYVVLPVLFLLSRRLAARAAFWAITIFILAAPTAIRIATGLGPTFQPEIHDPYCTGLNNFYFGVLLAGVDNLGWWRKGWGWLGYLGWPLMAAGLAGAAWARATGGAHAALVAGTFVWAFNLGTGCLLCYGAEPNHARVRWLCWPGLRWCGIISYEWYLFHQPMIYWCRGLLFPAGGNVGKYAVNLAVPALASVIFAALVYRLYSLPLLRFGRNQNAAKKTV